MRYLATACLVALSLTTWPHPTEAATRSQSAKYQFKKHFPCPATGKSKGPCPGWIIDHIVPLKRGGADHPINMQWQTVEDAKRKDRWE